MEKAGEKEFSEFAAPVVFFDGVCGGCNRFVDFVMAADRSGEILFAPFQGETAGRFSLRRSDDPRTWAMAYLDEKGIHSGPDAVFLILARLGGFWRIPALFRYFPGFVKRFFYAAVAGNRYRLFGRRDACRVPAAWESARFLP